MKERLGVGAEEVYFRLGALLSEAANTPEPRLLVNADALILEYNSKETNAKYFERIADLQKISS